LPIYQIIRHLNSAAWPLFLSSGIDTARSRHALVSFWAFASKFWKASFNNASPAGLAFASKFGVPLRDGSFQFLKLFAFWACAENSTNRMLWALGWWALRLPDLWWKVCLTNALSVCHKEQLSSWRWACFLRFGMKFGCSCKTFGFNLVYQVKLSLLYI
jgi:hypothetical protein